MIPLIDGDVLLWEIGSCETFETPGEIREVCGFQFVKELMDKRISDICYGCGGTEKPRIYLTGKGNFREKIAEQRGYKANRLDKVKPFHYENLKGYLIAVYGAQVYDGMEADDAMCIDQVRLNREGVPTVICSRDKDLRQCAGWHYSWECGKQAEWGPHLVEGLGELFLKVYPEGHKYQGRVKKLTGTGDLWFLAQMLMGDEVDNIPGLSGYGPRKVYDLLSACPSYEEAKKEVEDAYTKYYEKKGKLEEAKAAINEQAQLVWMVRELNEDGSLIMAEEFLSDD